MDSRILSKKIKRGMARAREKGRTPGAREKVSDAQIQEVVHLGTKAAAAAVGLSITQFIRRRRRLET